MSRVVVDWLLDAFARAQRFQVIHKKLRVKRIWVIEVDSMSKVQRHVTEVAVIRILLEIHDVLGADRRDDLLRYGSLTRAGPATDADNHSVVIVPLTDKPIELDEFDRHEWGVIKSGT